MRSQSLDRERFKPALDKLYNDYVTNGTAYPKDVPAFLLWLSKFRGKGGRSRVLDDVEDGALNPGSSFNQVNQDDGSDSGDGGGGGGRKKNPHKNKRCYNCGKWGHIAANCTGPSDDDSTKSGGSNKSGVSHAQTTLAWYQDKMKKGQSHSQRCTGWSG